MSSSRDKRLIEKAAEFCDEADSTAGSHRLAAILTDKKGNIISKGFNSLKSHPIQAEYAEKVNKSEAIYLHAEISALVKCRKDPHTIYITRLLKNGQKSMAKPCPICQLALKEAGVQRIVYTDFDGSISVEEVA